jgi:hypothetical protein
MRVKMALPVAPKEIDWSSGFALMEGTEFVRRLAIVGVHIIVELVGREDGDGFGGAEGGSAHDKDAGREREETNAISSLCSGRRGH